MREEKLARAMAALGAPAKDPGFVYVVMAQTEVLRYRRAMALALLSWGGLAAAAVALALPLLGWAAANLEVLELGLMAGACVMVLASTRALFRPALAIFLAR
jgi:hypothetical protein